MAPMLLAVSGALAIVSCQSSTPATRIEKNPVMYAGLPPAQQAAVRQGKVSVGMSQDAVFLAWGLPNSRPYVGEKDGKRVERWVYTVSQPVTVYNDGGAWGPTWGGYDYGWGGFSTAYVPENAATVVFENGKVISWESRR